MSAGYECNGARFFGANVETSLGACMTWCRRDSACGEAPVPCLEVWSVGHLARRTDSGRSPSFNNNLKRHTRSGDYELILDNRQDPGYVVKTRQKCGILFIRWCYKYPMHYFLLRKMSLQKHSDHKSSYSLVYPCIRNSVMLVCDLLFFFFFPSFLSLSWYLCNNKICSL